ncbi:hypothetical protein G5714_014365 [Onychostoma macrolepis]|uniref:Uncharacterized protein n=1 Tax=Onychostoma macrolepis TaxID=369639 RepID=A0A7J6CD77_9TELE|nr:hypothetical protein G5714_014365 [Onychostoma macrolepis]
MPPACVRSFELFEQVSLAQVMDIIMHLKPTYGGCDVVPLRRIKEMVDVVGPSITSMVIIVSRMRSLSRPDDGPAPRDYHNAVLNVSEDHDKSTSELNRHQHRCSAKTTRNRQVLFTDPYGQQ